jgi:integrase
VPAHQGGATRGAAVCRPSRYASVILEAGESVVTLARRLGHSSPTVTLDYKAHFMPEAGGKGRGVVDALLAQPAAVATAA